VSELSEKEDQEEYKKRMKEIIERVEKTKDKDSKYTEQDVIEKKEELLQILTRKTHEGKYRSEQIIAMLTYWIHSLYKFRTKKNQSQEEIDALYKLIYEQLKKPNILIPNPDPFIDRLDKRKILKNMEKLLGEKNIKSFIKRYNLKKDLDLNLSVKRIFYLIVIIGFSCFPIYLWVWYMFSIYT